MPNLFFLGEKNPDILNIKKWIAMFLHKKQKFDEAEKIFRDVKNTWTSKL